MSLGGQEQENYRFWKKLLSSQHVRGKYKIKLKRHISPEDSLSIEYTESGLVTLKSVLEGNALNETIHLYVVAHSNTMYVMFS